VFVYFAVFEFVVYAEDPCGLELWFRSTMEPVGEALEFFTFVTCTSKGGTVLEQKNRENGADLQLSPLRQRGWGATMFT
jgi:hypothetical protein